MESKGKAFRQLLRDEPYLFTGGIYSPLDAQIAESAGMKSIYLSGYSVAMMNGWPDMGLLTMTEVAKTASMVASAVEVPIIADADDGYGNALSTMRTVQEFVKTGVAGIHLEDQRFPKRCGHIAGKTVVSREEAIGKYKAALSERDRLDREFVIIARTDAYGAVGGSMEEAIWRGRAYADAGVDLVWCELSNSDRGPAIEFARAMKQTHPKLPLAFNYSSSFRWHKDPQPAHLPGAGRARLQVHLHHAVRRPCRHVLGVERHARAHRRTRSRPSGRWSGRRLATRPRATTSWPGLPTSRSWSGATFPAPTSVSRSSAGFSEATAH